MRFDRKTFFDGFRDRIDATIEQEQVDGCEFLLAGFERGKWDIRQIAYFLATVFHETAGSMQPVEEGYYLGSKARVQKFQKTLRYYPYFGRGFVQLTWKTNYKKAGDTFGVDLVKNPEKALDPEIAFQSLTVGMTRGWYGKKLSDFINAKTTDYVNARQTVNRMDKAGLIAGYAKSFEKILRSSAAAQPKPDGSFNQPDEPTTPGGQASPDPQGERHWETLDAKTIRRPERGEKMDWTETERVVREYVDAVREGEGESRLSKYEYAIFEAAVEAVFGEDIWDEINDLLE